MRTHVLITLAVLLSSSIGFANNDLSPQNKKILEYLGEPVIHTPEDSSYSPKTLLTEFKAACEKSEVKLLEVYVDTSEYPYLIYGAWQKKADNYRKLRPILSKHKPEKYNFQGSVGGQTYFAVDITPREAYPEGLSSRINKRTTIRMTILFDSLQYRKN